MKISPAPSVAVPHVDTNGQQMGGGPNRIQFKTDMSPLANQFPAQQPINSTLNETKEAVEATKPLSPQLALLAKQRRALQVKERELLAREKEFQSRSTSNPTIDLSRLKAEPLSVLLENGVTYEQLAEAVVAEGNRGANFNPNSLKQEMMESMNKGIEERFNKQTSAQEQQIYAQMRREAQDLARQEQFELVRETRSVPTVMQLIERTYKQSGEVLDVSEAMKLVEDELFKEAQKIARLKKLQSQGIPAQSVPQQRQMGMRTLTNRDTASMPMTAKQRALAAFYGQPIKR